MINHSLIFLFLFFYFDDKPIFHQEKIKGYKGTQKKKKNHAHKIRSSE